jgi:hypothetical protein
MGDGPSPIGGNPCPHRHRPKERLWNSSLKKVWNRPPPGRRKKCQQAPQRHQRARRRYPLALEEAEAGILQFEVSSVSLRAPSILRGHC